ncbi:NAD(P)/FAD-dependent oxidoreductase [Niveispirillum cyanobacteriorum]|uniref:FAD-dependent oxidoreductase n=1 Tax=Niveispirillum cyanobacteriorum TaxID=1612173 RepID=A0A2K9NHF4_9PROT|nr:FAD-binding oxidoreductase [Niveispirillum cyanobacteriorum]AUN32509.1 FAD-dependent oxidoreductase [Niveispirillum cyanobacteriorum]GGE77802.1 FAD-dependent oxidoreductase [Niveispirillum cyanobacteriorum]
MTASQTLSYWLDTAPRFTGGAAGPVEGRVDVAIIGGGFTGLSAALALAKQGASTIVLEAGRVAGEASGRNGGQCNSGTAHDFAALAGRFGVETARKYYQAHVDAVDDVARIAREEGIDCSFRRCGRLKLAAKPEHYDKLARAADTLATVDPNVHLLSRADLASEIRSDDFHGGLLQTTSAQLHVGRFGVGLAEAAARKGALIHEGAPVTGLANAAGGGWELRTPKGLVHAKQVLVATGGASPVGPFGWFRRRIVSVGSFVIATERLPEAMTQSLFPGQRNYVTSKNIGNYFRLSPDNRLIFGGRARFAVSDPLSDAKSGRILDNAMRTLFPALKDVKVDYCWGGMVDLTADRLPRAGEHDGIFYAMGYSGHGTQMAVHMGERMARVMGGDPSANPWANLSWPPVPGHLGKPWFLPLVGLYYRIQDILH